MHIAHVMPTLAEWYGGPVNTVLNLGAAQQQIGMNVTYLATGDEETKRKLADIPGDVQLFHTKWPNGWFRSPEFVRKLDEQITSFDLIEIHGIWEYTVFTAAGIARKTNIPYIIRPTGVFTHPWRYRSLKKRLYSALIANRTLNGTACLHVASQKEADGCRRAGLKAPIAVVPNGIDTKDFEVLPDPQQADELWPIFKDRQIVLFLSRISPEKGFAEYIPAIRTVLKQTHNKNILFVIAGPDHRGYLATVKDLVKNHNLESNVFFPGMVRGSEKLALYSRADLFVLPSYSENYGIVIAEALACGTPVVTTTGTPWKEMEQVDAGRRVKAEKDQLAAAILELLEMPKKDRDEMGRRGRKLVLEKHTWEIAAKKLQKVYQCILQKKDIPAVSV